MGQSALRATIVIAAASIVSACAGSPRTDLARLYSMQSGNPAQPPVVVIHGVLGSRLAHADTGDEVWPGGWQNLLFGSFRELRLDIDPETLTPLPSPLVTTDIARGALGVDFYGRILTTLRDVAGFRPATPGVPAVAGEKRFYVFAYDWRQDNVDSARLLSAFIDRIRDDYGDPNLKVDVIAHSMGGLITRYFLRYGELDVLNDNDFPVSQSGASRIRRVVLLGTPNLGSVGALRTLIRGYKVGFGTIPPEIVATFPSTYQLLPHAITDWFVTMDGRPLKRDQFSADDFWRRFGFSIFDADVQRRIRRSFDDAEAASAYIELLQDYFRKHVERARRFSWSLTVPVHDVQIRYIVFGGDCLPTPARAVVEPDDGDWALRLAPDEIVRPVPGIDYRQLMLEPGDGTVTKASLLARDSTDPTIARHRYSFFPLDYPVFLCEKHSQLTGNIDFQNNLLHALLSVDR